MPSATSTHEEVNMAANPAPDATWPVQGERITVALVPAAQDDLRRLQERTKLSKTDLANRAITSYQFFDAHLQAGRDVIVRDNRTGETQLVRFL
jgi:hypothetical protein